MPSHKLLPLISQLACRLGSSSPDGEGFQQALRTLLLRVARCAAPIWLFSCAGSVCAVRIGTVRGKIGESCSASCAMRAAFGSWWTRSFAASPTRTRVDSPRDSREFGPLRR